MSATDYAHISTSELVQKFADTAKRTGSVFGPNKEKLTQTPQRQALVQEMQALGEELRNRKPIAELRKLFEDEDPDVRGWAGPQFGSVDSEWADATVDGLFHKLTTHEVLAWRRRILRRPSQSPALGKMSVAQLVDCFVDACERCYGTTRFLSGAEGGGPSMRAHNRVSGDIYAAAKELNRRGELRALVPLLKHPLITVRERAAAYSLPVATEPATAALNEIAAAHTFPEFLAADRTLQYWRKGEYCAFPDDPQRIRI